MDEVGWKAINRVIEQVTKSEVGNFGWKVINGLVEIITKSVGVQCRLAKTDTSVIMCFDGQIVISTDIE